MLIYNFQEYIAKIVIKGMKNDSKVAKGKQNKNIIKITYQYMEASNSHDKQAQ